MHSRGSPLDMEVLPSQNLLLAFAVCGGAQRTTPFLRCCASLRRPLDPREHCLRRRIAELSQPWAELRFPAAVGVGFGG